MTFLVDADLSKEWLFVSDVDDTLLGNGPALRRLSAALAAAREKVIIVYNSSRPCASLRETLAQEAGMLTPDYLAGAMGTEIERGASGERIEEYDAVVAPGWEREALVRLIAPFNLTPHAPQYQTRFKISYDAPDPAAALYIEVLLREAGLPAKVVYSGGKNLDIIPRNADKGAPIEFLRARHRLPPERVVVAGDSGNDLDMFVPPRKGIVVANASDQLKGLQDESIYCAQSPHAAGVLEGLRYWRVL